MKEIKLKENERVAVSKLKETLGERFSVLDFCVFGSRARGDSLPESDIYVMIEIENYTPEIESAID